MKQVLIIEDKKPLLKMLSKVMEEEGYHAVGALNLKTAEDRLSENDFDFILSDLRLPDGESINLLESGKSKNVPFLIMTGFGTIEKAVKAMKLGAIDFIEKPVDIDELLLKMKSILDERSDKSFCSENKTETEVLSTGEEIIYKSNEMKDVIRIAKRISKINVSVLLTGESGTGKELIARLIHDYSNRDTDKFIAINCAAIPNELLESELFGSEKGAFTGSSKRVIGKFELADKGTLLLDEIGDMNTNLQAKLLRVLEEKKFRRIGGSELVNIDTRIIASTNKNLDVLRKNNLFREDLFYRLTQFRIHIPSLNERKEDIRVLSEYLMNKLIKEYNYHEIEINEKIFNLLTNIKWKGNVRELKNLLSQSLLNSSGKALNEKIINGYIKEY